MAWVDSPGHGLRGRFRNCPEPVAESGSPTQTSALSAGAYHRERPRETGSPLWTGDLHIAVHSSPPERSAAPRRGIVASIRQQEPMPNPSLTPLAEGLSPATLDALGPDFDVRHCGNLPIIAQLLAASPTPTPS